DRYRVHPVCEHIKLSYLKSNNLVLLTDGRDERVLMLLDNPNDTARVLSMEHLLGTRQVRISVGLPDDIHQYLGLASLGFDVADDSDNDVELVFAKGNALEEPQVTQDSDGPDVVQLVYQLLLDAKRWNASDVHIEPGNGQEPTRVRMRIDGGCQESIQVPANHTRAIISRIKVMAHMDISERRIPQDGKFSVRMKGVLLDFRVATIPTVNGEAMVLRLLQSGEPIPFSRLNLSARNAEQLESLLATPHGLLLVVGPTGSGKTTTLHALLSKINTPDRKIWTAEDPVEITQSGLQQVQVQPKIGFDFATALRAFLRADPDVILIGEMRDRETAKAAVDAALTGHLVLSTLHTNSAAETITRLLGLDIDPDNFSEALLGVVAQRLVRTLCPDCKQAYHPDQDEVDLLKRKSGSSELALTVSSTLFRPKGCAACNNAGYKGRIGIHELLVSGDTIRQMVNHNADAGAIARQAISDGMQTLLQDGISKILAGLIDYEQLKRVAAE
ncbi:MAG: GspE/PulE family protein, partial [Pontibacterium sp.]